jgi:diadenylate cyclase
MQELLFQIGQAFARASARDWFDMAAMIVLTHIAVTALSRTRAWRVAGGVAVVGLLYLVSSRYLPVIHWIMHEALVPGVVGLLILFQPEIRTVLAQIGGAYSRRGRPTGGVVDALVDACAALSSKRTGALIAIERAAPLSDIVLSGSRLDARLSVELLSCVFFPNNPLHDGGLVVSGSRIVAASCYFPTSTNPSLPVSLGMRHRAALGLSEQTDAVCLVVSEESGAVSLAVAGRLQHRLTREALRATLQSLLGESRPSGLQRWWGG